MELNAKNKKVKIMQRCNSILFILRCLSKAVHSIDHPIYQTDTNKRKENGS
jgi:hypothetical protein